VVLHALLSRGISALQLGVVATQCQFCLKQPAACFISTVMLNQTMLR
jgi:hypothetical protein